MSSHSAANRVRFDYDVLGKEIKRLETINTAASNHLADAIFNLYMFSLKVEHEKGLTQAGYPDDYRSPAIRKRLEDAEKRVEGLLKRHPELLPRGAHPEHYIEAIIEGGRYEGEVAAKEDAKVPQERMRGGSSDRRGPNGRGERDGGRRGGQNGRRDGQKGWRPALSQVLKNPAQYLLRWKWATT